MNAKETFTLHGEHLVKKVKEIIAEGTARKITITDKSGKELMTFPLTVGVVGAIFAPILAAVGALAALIGECTITVEREEKKGETEAAAPAEEPVREESFIIPVAGEKKDEPLQDEKKDEPAAGAVSE